MTIDIDIEKIYKDFLVNDVNMEVLEETVYKQVCVIGCDVIKTILQTYDKDLLKTRDKKKYSIDGKKRTTVKTVMGDVEYRRRIYRTKSKKKGKKYIFLLDNKLKENNEMIGNISPSLTKEIVTSIGDISYRKVSNDLERKFKNVSLSHQAIWNVVQQHCEYMKRKEDESIKNAFKDDTEPKKRVDVLFQEVDGLWINIQGQKSKKELKLGVIYEGWKKRDKKGKEFVTVNKSAYSCFNVSRFWELNDVMVSSQYDIDFIKLNILNGDGAKWIKNGVCSNVIYQIDRFHIHQAIVRAFTNYKGVMGDMMSLLKNRQIDNLISLAKVYADKENATKYMVDLYNYLTNNKEYLLRYNERDAITVPRPQENMYYRNLGTMEHNVCDILSQRMSNNKTSWSVTGAENMARILCQRVNNKR